MTNIFDAIEKDNLELVKVLIAERVNLEEFNDEGLLPIHLAAINNNFEIVKLLVESGANINSLSSLEISLAHIAAGQFDKDKLDWLFANGLNINSEGLDRVMPIHTAAMAGSLENVKWFINKGSEERTVQGSNLLHIAAIGNFDGFLQSIKKGTMSLNKSGPISDEQLPKYIELLRYLIEERGMGINDKDDYGVTPLCNAAGFGNVQIMNFFKKCGGQLSPEDIVNAISSAATHGHIEVIKCFAAEGVDVNRVDERGGAPIFMAARGGHVKVMEYLLKLGADLYSLDPHGMSLMHSAVLSDDPEVIEWVLDKGLDVNAPNAHGNTPASFGESNGKINALKYLAQKGADVNLENLWLRSNPKLTIELIQWLRSKGYNIRAEKNGLMHCAAYNGQIDIIEYLMSEGIDVNIKDEEGKTPIYYATKKGKFKAIKYLYEHGADLKTQDDKGDTLMHIAARKGKVHIIQWLLDKDVPVDSRNFEGKTPVNGAAQKGKLSIIEYLGKKGADIANVESYAQDLIEHAAVERDMNMVKWLEDQKVDMSGLTFTVDSRRLTISPPELMEAAEWISQYGVKVIITDVAFEPLISQAALSQDEKMIEDLKKHAHDAHFVISMSPGYFGNLEDQIKGTYWLLEKGVKVNIEVEAIQNIIFCNREKVDEIIKWFVDLDVQIDPSQDYSTRILSFAAREGKVKVMEWIKKYGVLDLNLPDAYGNTLLHEVVRGVSLQMLKWCVGNGANPNVKDNYGNTPLSSAISMDKFLFAKFLLENGADLNIKDNHGNTPLFSAISSNKPQYVKLLLEYGVDFNMPSNNGTTPLSSAIYGNKIDMIVLLCSFKADINIDDFTVRNYFTNQDHFQQILSQGTTIDQIIAGLHILETLRANPQTQARGVELEQILLDKIGEIRPDVLDNLELLDTRTNLKAILINLDKCKDLEGLEEKIQSFNHDSESFRALSFLNKIKELNLTQKLGQKERDLMTVATTLKDDGSAKSEGMTKSGLEITSFLDNVGKTNLFVSPIAAVDQDDQVDAGGNLYDNPQVEATGGE